MNSIISGGNIISSVLPTKIILNVLLNTISGTINSVNYIVSNDSIPEVNIIKNKIIQMDLNSKLEIIHSLIKELNEEKLKEFQKISLKSIEILIDEINKELIDINQKINYHNSKYFSSWRSINLDNNINQLNDHNILLDKRLDNLIKLLNLNL